MVRLLLTVHTHTSVVLTPAGTWCQLDVGIVVTPDRNQTIPFASDENVTYSCSVDGRRSAIWEVRGRQIIGQAQASMFADSGFFVKGLGANTSVIRISGEARRNASQNEINLLCVALRGLTGTPGKEYFIITYGGCIVVPMCTL